MSSSDALVLKIAPHETPERVDVSGDLDKFGAVQNDAIREAIGDGWLCLALRSERFDGVPDFYVFCDDEAAAPWVDPRPPLAFNRPTDGSPVFGTICITGVITVESPDDGITREPGPLREDQVGPVIERLREYGVPV